MQEIPVQIPLERVLTETATIYMQYTAENMSDGWAHSIDDETAFYFPLNTFKNTNVVQITETRKV